MNLRFDLQRLKGKPCKSSGIPLKRDTEVCLGNTIFITLIES